MSSKSSVKLNLKLKRTKKDKIKREEKLVRLHKLSLKGPRVKHVCRSASLVLGQPVATFTDTSPSKQKSCSSGKDLDCENLLSSSRSGINREEYSGYSNLKNAEQGVRMKQAGDNEHESNQSGKNKSLLSKTTISDESTDISLLDGRGKFTTLVQSTMAYRNLLLKGNQRASVWQFHPFYKADSPEECRLCRDASSGDHDPSNPFRDKDSKGFTPGNTAERLRACHNCLTPISQTKILTSTLHNGCDLRLKNCRIRTHRDHQLPAWSHYHNSSTCAAFCFKALSINHSSSAGGRGFLPSDQSSQGGIIILKVPTAAARPESHLLKTVGTKSIHSRSLMFCTFTKNNA
ncbi:hypothetical protein J6590_055057 [Homalodisca vitripennis]|nr:hypothetical protein J6590_055057 [Homalodisca vitripennis]